MASKPIAFFGHMGIYGCFDTLLNLSSRTTVRDLLKHAGSLRQRIYRYRSKEQKEKRHGYLWVFSHVFFSWFLHFDSWFYPPITFKFKHFNRNIPTHPPVIAVLKTKKPGRSLCRGFSLINFIKQCVSHSINNPTSPGRTRYKVFVYWFYRCSRWQKR